RDRLRGRFHCRRLHVVEAEEDRLRIARERLLVRDERGQGAVQPQIERGGAVARVGVRTERHDLERGVREHAVECLLTRVAAASDDDGGNHGKYYAKL